MGRRRAILRAVLGASLVLLLIGAITGVGLWRAVFRPSVDGPIAQADALLVLGPADGKLAEAVQLMNDGAADTLVISDQDQRDGTPGACRPEVVDEVLRLGWAPGGPHQLLCFRPIPVTTQGEAMGIHNLGAHHGWTSLNVLAYPEHITRARILVDRCWSEESAYLAAPDRTASQGGRAAWNAFWYQSGALGKAALTPGCDDMLPPWLEQLSWRL
ncbi:hypothetical protein [Micrococcus terreus]|uniref:hypothetical protein n=1 Tax=Micrococcus terreus TaxID=574650 RepID=UPI001160C9D7|nr:hypothetical protein [Micrococcus terreus]